MDLSALQTLCKPDQRDWIDIVLVIAQVAGALGSVIIPLIAVYFAHRIGRDHALNESKARSEIETRVRREERELALNRDVRAQRLSAIRDLEELITDIYVLLYLAPSENDLESLQTRERAARITASALFLAPDSISGDLAEAVSRVLNRDQTREDFLTATEDMRSLTAKLIELRNVKACELLKSHDEDASRC